LQNKLLKNDEYPPSEDTFFIANNIEHEKGTYALDIGSGSGYLTKLLCKNFSFVIGTDINCDVLQNQSSYKTDNLICCNGSDALNIKFDFIVCNLPYLATDEILDIATDGGSEGFEIPKKIFDSALRNLKKNGKFIFVTSSLSNHSKLINYAEKIGLKTRIISQKKLFFEELILVEAIN
jgi:release factor glutamine methyltransferase